MEKKSKAASLPLLQLHCISFLPPPITSAHAHFQVQIEKIGPTPLQPQFDTTNLELVFDGSLEYITSPEHNNNGGASIKLVLCIHCRINKAYLWVTRSVRLSLPGRRKECVSCAIRRWFTLHKYVVNDVLIR